MKQVNQIDQDNLPEDEPFSLKNELKNLWLSVVFALIHWKLLLLASLVGVVLGFGYFYFKPVSYTANTTFIVEESKMGGGSIASALAGQFGLDMGSLTGSSSGMLAGDNVLELVKSHSLIRKTLLTYYDSANSKLSLADVYAETKGWKEKWESSSKVGKRIDFSVDGKNIKRTEDSLLQKIINEIVKTDLQIAKPDKKLSFFELTVATRDEKLSLLFSQRLIRTTADFYINTKTKRLTSNVNRLQAKADSLAFSLNRKTFSVADAGKILLDGNPAYTTPGVTAEISNRDKYMQATIYAEIVKNLEISKTALIQETPTIQIVDEPETPLKDNKIYWWLASLIGAALLAFITGIIIIATKKQGV